MACFSSEEALESAAAATLLRSPETKERLKIYLFQDLQGEGGGERVLRGSHSFQEKRRGSK